MEVGEPHIGQRIRVVVESKGGVGHTSKGGMGDGDRGGIVQTGGGGRDGDSRLSNVEVGDFLLGEGAVPDADVVEFAVERLYNIRGAIPKNQIC